MDIKQMRIEVVLTDQVNENIANYDENRNLFEANQFEAKKNQMFYMSNLNSTGEATTLIVGTDGCESDYDFVDLGATIGKKINSNCDLKLTIISENLNTYLIELGIILSTYRFENFKSQKTQEIDINILDSEFSTEIENKVSSIFWVRDMVNFPALTKSPEFFENKVKELIDGLDISFKSHDEEWLKENNMGGVIGVSQGSERSPKFLIGEYNTKAKKQIALIGKGVLFDSGGLSLKSPSGMETMKTDMAGAATAWGIIALVAKQGLDIGLKVYTPIVENMPSGTAIRPGDILHMRNGKTIEVINTDAEGRLIMADALAFASESKPDIICDVATLTGAAYVALGVEIGAVFSNNKVTLDSFLNSNNDGFENYHSLPLEQSYKSQIKSNIADMKNSGGRFGGAITAALLLEEFVDDLNWIHLDIAGPARSRSSNSIYPEGGTGFGVLGYFNFLANEANG
jgi:leucyl aminopeptidase|tara:strand:- start:2435 stop:3808 length:1374 start_codon:yes stop_codon:yes gene_type:complete